MLAALDRPGVWRRAGLNGIPIGLGMTDALAGLPGGIDHDLARRLLAVAEAEFLAAWHAHNAETGNGTA